MGIERTGKELIEPFFLTVTDLLSIHDAVLRITPDEPAGVLSWPALRSCQALPQQSFGDKYLYAFPYEMAAAYTFFIARNHPFMAANKRVALIAAVVFLKLNSIEGQYDQRRFVHLIQDVIGHKTDLYALADFLSQPLSS